MNLAMKNYLSNTGTVNLLTIAYDAIVRNILNLRRTALFPDTASSALNAL